MELLRNVIAGAGRLLDAFSPREYEPPHRSGFAMDAHNLRNDAKVVQAGLSEQIDKAHSFRDGNHSKQEYGVKP